jgi:hypothetical protein
MTTERYVLNVMLAALVVAAVVVIIVRLVN